MNHKQLITFLGREIKVIERAARKELWKELGKDLTKELENTAPVVTGKLKSNFYFSNTPKKVIIKDKMEYWFWVEFGPHKKPSMGFSRRALNKKVTKENVDRILKKIWVWKK